MRWSRLLWWRKGDPPTPAEKAQRWAESVFRSADGASEQEKDAFFAEQYAAARLGYQCSCPPFNHTSTCYLVWRAVGQDSLRPSGVPAFRGQARPDPEHPCRIMPTRRCPPPYDGVCGDRPCARFESDDLSPWLIDLAEEAGLTVVRLVRMNTCIAPRPEDRDDCYSIDLRMPDGKIWAQGTHEDPEQIIDHIQGWVSRGRP